MSDRGGGGQYAYICIYKEREREPDSVPTCQSTGAAESAALKRLNLLQSRDCLNVTLQLGHTDAAERGAGAAAAVLRPDPRVSAGQSVCQTFSSLAAKTRSSFSVFKQ